MEESIKPIKRIFVFFWFLFLPILLFGWWQTALAAMQIPTFSVTGVVSNEQGAVLPDVRVDLFDVGNCAFGAERCLEYMVYNTYTAHTNSQGRYSFTGMQCTDNNVISIEVDGYEKYLEKVSFPCWATSEYDIILLESDGIDPVIIIPGIMGSWNTQALAGMPSDNWVLDPIFHVYDQLKQNLIDYGGYAQGETLFTFPYDWRNNNVITAAYLKDKIDEVKSITGAEKVDLIAHSMGGLVSRFYIESELYENDVDQVIFIATPHLGAPKSYLTWEAGFMGIGLKDIIKEKAILQIAEVNGYDSVFEYVREEPLGSVQDLLPTYGYLFDLPGNVLRLYPDNYPRNERLEFFNQPENLNKLYSSGVEITEIYSDISDSTISSYDVIEPTFDQIPLWEHGYVNGFTKWSRNEGVNLGYGDETVPTASASYLNSDYEIKYYNYNHAGIVDRASRDVIDILTGQYIEINVIDEPNDYIIIQVFSPVDLQIVSPSGKIVGKDFVNNSEINEINNAFYTGFDTEIEFITIPDPEQGEYEIITQGTGEGEYKIDFSLVGDEQIKTKSAHGYTIPGLSVSYSAILSDIGLEEFASQDQTPPEISITIPAPTTYLHSDIINIDYEVEDNESGIHSVLVYFNNNEYSPSTIDLFEYHLGNYEFKISADDRVGNKAEEIVNFEIIASFDSLRSDINRLYDEGDIKNHRIKKMLLRQVSILEKWYNKIKKLEQRNKFLAKQKLVDKIRTKWLDRFNNKYLWVLQKSGLITEKAREMLFEQTKYIINNL